MRVLELSLTDFRNYASVSLRFAGMLNVFIGQNAQGKTNLLESLYLLAAGHSPRASRDAEMIRWGAQKARILARVERAYGTVELEMVLQAGVAKRITVNGNAVRRLADVFGHLNVVAFTPDDLQLVKGSPALRRRFLDYEIAQVSPAYRDYLERYHRVLKQRNTLLKAIAEGEANAQALAVWDPQLVEYGSRVIVKRAEMVAALAPLAEEIHARITEGKERLQLEYRPFFFADGESDPAACKRLDWVRDRFRADLDRLRKAEIARGASLVGPQRDDVRFVLNGNDARLYGSQGQQRTAVLACKLAEIEYMKEEAGEAPILLLDDVMSELDASRRAFLVAAVQDHIQTFITSAHPGDLGDALLARAHLFHIRQGTVQDAASPPQEW